MRPKPVLHETEANYRDTETDTDTENVVSHPWLLLGSKLLGHRYIPSLAEVIGLLAVLYIDNKQTQA